LIARLPRLARVSLKCTKENLFRHLVDLVQETTFDFTLKLGVEIRYAEVEADDDLNDE